jgi:hypothetical protein
MRKQMGRTYRQKDKRFKKQLKEGRRVRKNKRHIGIEEISERPTKDRDKKNSVGYYLFA